MPRILVIDDEEGTREVLKSMLELDGHEVDVAANGARGIEQFEKEPADLVIVDIFMPEKGGIETIMELKKAKPGLKIVAISGDTRLGPQRLLNWAKKAGADLTLTKPLEIVDINSAIKELLG